MSTFRNLPPVTTDAILTVPDIASLPADGVIEGAIRYVEDIDALYTFDGSAWNTAGGVQPPSPAITTDNAVARWDGTTGAGLNNSGVIIDDSDNITGVVGLTATGTVEANAFEAGGFNGTEKALYSTAAKIVEQSSVTKTELEYLSGVTSNVQDQLDDKIDLTEKGAALGVATLDGGGKVPGSQLPNSVMDYLGNWSAATNTPTLANGVGNAGDVYQNTAVGTVDFGAGPIGPFAIGDFVIYSGSVWQLSLNSNAVVSVNGFTGIVDLAVEDLDGATITTTELNYLAGVTSDIQTQLGNKVNSASVTLDESIAVFQGLSGTDIKETTVTIDPSGNMNGIADLTASGTITSTGFVGNLAVVTGAGGELTESAATDTEVGYLVGVTSNIQDQIDNKMDIGGSHTTLSDIGTNSHAQIDTHIASTSNPHSVTATQVGLGNVDNTSDATKNAAAVALTNKTIDGNSNTLTVLAGTQLSGVAPLANGGTAKALTAVSGGIVWSDADSLEVSAAGTAGQILTSGGAATPAWVTTVPIANGGTGAATAQAAINALAGATTDNRVLQGNGTNIVLGQIDDPAFFTSGANATSSLPGLIPTYAKSTFTANLIKSGGSGTLGTATVVTQRYVKTGSLCHVELHITPITVSTNTVTLDFTLPFAAKSSLRPIYNANDNGTSGAGRIILAAGSSTAGITPNLTSSSWAVSAANSTIFAIFDYEVDE